MLNTNAQVSGLVFRDINANGVRELSAPLEPGEYNVQVSAYNTANTLLATVFTDASGNYNFTAGQVPTGTAVRIEFTGPAGSYPSRKIAPDRTNVQFVVAGISAVNIDYAITDKRLSSATSNPYVATTKYTNGNPLTPTLATHAGSYDNLHVFPYNLSSAGTVTQRAKNQYTGAVFGLAWQRESRLLFMSSYLKRHCGFGPNGIGAIYKCYINTAGVPTNPSLLCNVTSMGINVGTNPRTVALPLVASTPNEDPGVFAEVGKRGIGGIDISADGRDLYLVNMFEKKLHRINIGNPIKPIFSGTDVTGTWNIPNPNISGTNWRPMALKMFNQKLYIGGICTKETNSDQNFSDTANLRGVVFEFNPTTGVFTEVLRFPLSHRRGYINADYRYENRNNFWNAWQNNGEIAPDKPLRTGFNGPGTRADSTGIYYPQPMFAAIEFDVDGSMIIGLRDRFGDQGGYANFFENNPAGYTFTTFSMGEMLRAGKTSTGYALENAATVTSAGVTTTTPGLADNNPALTGSYASKTGTPWGGTYGPGGKYYYYNQNFTLTAVPAPWNTLPALQFHYVKATGGLAILPGSNEILYTALDPTDRPNTHGVLKNANLGANAGNMVGRLHMLGNTSGNPDNMGKSAAFGEIELLIDAHAVEIGNRVWNDQNANGRQDAAEPGIANVTVQLRSPGINNIYNDADDQLWTTVTDANGNYFFDRTLVNDTRRPSSWFGVSGTNSGILPGYEYKVLINNLQLSLGIMWPTLLNAQPDHIDNDGAYEGVSAMVVHILNPGGPAASNSSFENTYNIDFGFTNNRILSGNAIVLNAQKQNDKVKLQWRANGSQDGSLFDVEFSTNGTQFQKAAVNIPFVNGTSVYSFLHNYDADKAVYYRIREVSTGAAVQYSNVAFVKSDFGTITISPNPFSDFIGIRYNAALSEKALIQLTDAAGKTLLKKEWLLKKGSNNLPLTGLQKMPSGNYFVKIRLLSSGVNASVIVLKR